MKGCIYKIHKLIFDLKGIGLSENFQEKDMYDIYKQKLMNQGTNINNISKKDAGRLRGNKIVETFVISENPV